ncbi:MAG TPA: hypothetical protein VGG28_29640 [Kofleriaceae bacterium]|jgi:hypothetical protein
MRWLLAFAAVCCGCTDPASLDTETVAQTFCDCITPGATSSCVADLEPELATITPQCSTCIDQYETSCMQLEAICEPQCIQQELPDA